MCATAVCLKCLASLLINLLNTANKNIVTIVDVKIRSRQRVPLESALTFSFTFRDLYFKNVNVFDHSIITAHVNLQSLYENLLLNSKLQ